MKINKLLQRVKDIYDNSMTDREFNRFGERIIFGSSEYSEHMKKCRKEVTEYRKIAKQISTFINE
jgi:hypothetical protein